MVDSVTKPLPWWWLKLFDTRTNVSKSRVFEKALIALGKDNTPPMVLVDDASNVIHKAPQTGLFRMLCSLAEPNAAMVVLVGSHASAFQDMAQVDHHSAIRTHFIHLATVRDPKKLQVYVRNRAAAKGRAIGEADAAALVQSFGGFFTGYLDAFKADGKISTVLQKIENNERAVIGEILRTTSGANELLKRVVAAPQGISLSSIAITDQVVNLLLHRAVLTIENEMLCFPYPLKANAAKSVLA